MPQDSASAASRRAAPIVAGAAFIIVATFIAYLPAIRAGFIWDDDQYVTENVLLRSADGLRLIWATLGATPQYYPLTHTTFWIEHHLWGNDPLGYHLVNVVLHISSALLLWRILSLLGLRAAWLAAAVFALHPIEVESVAWITERKNVLCCVFYFGAMLAYLSGWRALSLPLFACALLSKTVAATLPAAILLILWWRDGHLGRRDILFVLPMLLFAILMGSLTSWMERTQVGAVGPEWQYSFVDRLLIAARAVWFYALQLLVPCKLTFIYPKWEIGPRSLSQWLFPVAVVGVVATLVLTRKRLGRGPLVAVLYFIGTLFPALGFINTYPMRYSFVADHFQYLAGVGLIVLGSELLIRLLRVDAKWLTPIPLLLGVLTWHQSQMYRDARTLWETTLQRNPKAWIAHDHLAAIIGTTDLETALGHYAIAKELNPNHIEVYIGMGNLLLQDGRDEAALEQYRGAIAVRPDHPTPYYALARALSDTGDMIGAVEAYEQALRVDPGFIPARLKLAELYTKLGRSDDAAREHAEAQRQMRQMLGR